jgi:hypothetical protein
MKAKRPVPLYYWPFWMAVLALGLFVFYVLFTPVWMGIRLISWLAKRRNMASLDSGRQAAEGPASPGGDRRPGRSDKK